MPKAILPESHEHWLSLRAEDVTSTEAAALFGLSPYQTLMELHYLKSGKSTLAFEATDRMKWGNRLEEAIARGIGEDLGLKVRKVNAYYRHDTVPRMGSSFDYEIIDHPNGPGILEIKNVDRFMYLSGWEEDQATDQIELQVQHQMEVMNRNWCMICPLVGGNEAKPFIRERDRAVGAAIVEKINSFWHGVDNNIDPEIDYTRDAEFIISLHQASGAGMEVQMPGLEQYMAEYDHLGGQAKQIDERRAALKAEMFDAIGDDVGKVLAGSYTLSCKMTAGTEPTLITPDMVGTTYGGRKAFRNFRITQRKEK